MKKFVFFYFMKNQPEEIRSAVPVHIEYWKKAGVSGYSGGPFADHSGGLILFDAAGAKEASAIIGKDPFVSRDLLEERWLKEWLPHP